LSWVLQSNASIITSGECGSIRIYSVTISGIKGLQSGPTECTKCPAGYFGSEFGKCDPCPAGSSSMSGDLKCFECENETFSGVGYGRCVPCGAGTTANVTHESCMFNCADIELTSYEPNLKKGVSNAHYNLTFVEPKPLQIGSGTYTMGICELVDCESSSAPVHLCAKIWDAASQSNQVLAGDLISFTSYKAAPREGIVVMFNSTKLNRCLLSVLFQCDPTRKEDDVRQWFRSEVRCNENIVWRSKMACRDCSDEDITYTYSPCIGSKQNKTAKLRSDMCIFDYLPDVEVVACENRVKISVAVLVIILVVSFLVLAAAVAVIIFLVIRNRRIYGKYNKLRMESETNLDTITKKNKKEVVPSAAVDDESEEKAEGSDDEKSEKSDQE